MKNLINSINLAMELENLGFDVLKMKSNEEFIPNFFTNTRKLTNEESSSMERFLNPQRRADMPDIDIDFPETNEKVSAFETEEFLNILKLAEELANNHEKEISQSLKTEVLTAIDKVNTIQQNLSYNRPYILKTHKVESHRDLSIRYGAVWKEFLIRLNQLVDEIELIAIAMEYKSEEDLYNKFNYLFSQEHIAGLLKNEGIHENLVNSWLQIK